MNLKLLSFCIFCLVLCIGNSCTYVVLPEPEEPAVCVNEPTTYDAHLKALIDNSCAYSGCHDGQGAPGNFTTYEGLKPFFESSTLFQERVIDLKDNTSLGMPPNYAPADKPQDFTEEELALVQCWIDGGYLEN